MALGRDRAADLVVRRGHLSGVGTAIASVSEVAAQFLLALDRLEQRFEVALAEAERSVPLDELEEHRGAVADRAGEDLQQITVLVAVDQDVAALRLLILHPDLT